MVIHYDILYYKELQNYANEKCNNNAKNFILKHLKDFFYIQCKINRSSASINFISTAILVLLSEPKIHCGMRLDCSKLYCCMIL